MGNVVDRIGDWIVVQSAGLTEGGRRRRGGGGRASDSDSLAGQGYTYPTKDGSPFFSSHFIMGGERFDTYQPEAFLFGENLDLNFLGSRPTPFPYPAPLANEPTRALTSLLNIRKESLRFIRVTDPDLVPKSSSEASSQAHGQKEAGSIISSKEPGSIISGKEAGNKKSSSKGSDGGSGGGAVPVTGVEKERFHYTIEFMFDSDVACSARIFYFCNEETSGSGSVTYVPKDWDICSDSMVFGRGAGQTFSQSRHIFTPSNFDDVDLVYSAFDENGLFDHRVPFPVVIQLQALEGPEPRQSQALIAVVERNSHNKAYCLKPFVQKVWIDGLSYLLQEIYGIENKMPASLSSESAAQKFMSPEEEEECNSASECVVCLSDPRDTLILPCRHLCLCNACADSLRYQANNCPICRSPFRALLQIRAVRSVSNVLPPVPHSQSMGSMMVLPLDPVSPPVPIGYESLPLIEALNGALPVSRDRAAPDIDRTPVSVRRSHNRRHKHSSGSSHGHHHHTHHTHVRSQVLAPLPVQLSAQQQLPALVSQQAACEEKDPHVTAAQAMLHESAAVSCNCSCQEVIALPTRRVLPAATSAVAASACSTDTSRHSEKVCEEEKVCSPPEPAPVDWQLLPGCTLIRRKQSDETSSSASSTVHETTRLLHENHSADLTAASSHSDETDA